MAYGVIRVIVVARAPALRAGLAAMLDAPQFEVVGEAATLSHALDDGLPRGDVAVMADNFSRADNAARAQLAPGVVLLARDDEIASLASELRATRPSPAGWAIVRADCTARELQAAAFAAANGLMALPVQFFDQPLSALGADTSSAVTLTPREVDILELVSRGQPNKAIAAALGISESTVKFHMAAAFEKLGASSRAEAVSKAAREGLITL